MHNFIKITQKIFTFLILPIFLIFHEVIFYLCIFINISSMLKLIQLLNCENVKVLNGIGIFYIKANEKRKNELSIVSD